MKKIFLMLTAVVMTAGIMSAQDVNAVLEIYNNGAMELQMGNKEAALNYFQEALSQAEALGDEGVDIVTNCTNTIPALYFEIAKDFIEAKNYDAAIAQIDKTLEVAAKYNDVLTPEKATEILPKVYLSKGNELFKAKNAAGAIEAYEKSVELDSTNAIASLQLGRVYLATGNEAGAEASFFRAARNGREKDAMKQLSTYYLKKAQTSNKDNNFQEVIEFANKSNSFLENANAYRFAASAYQKLGNNADCISNYEKYLELSPNAKDAGGVIFTIAALYQQAGNKEKAKEFYQKVATDPQFGVQAQEQLKNL